MILPKSLRRRSWQFPQTRRGISGNRQMKKKIGPFIAICLLLTASAHAAEAPEKLPPKPTSHTTRQIEGWTVRIDDRLLSGDDAAIGERAIKLLSARLFLITMVVSDKPLAELRKVPIQIDLTHGAL